jgi:hypothetical protein
VRRRIAVAPRLVLVSAALAATVAVGACGSSSPTPTPTPVPATVTPTVEAISPELPPVAASASVAPASTTGAPAQDPSLLGILPAAVAGVPVTLEEQAFADAATDPAFAANVEDAAFGVVADGEDLASAVVAHLVPGTYSERFFRDWRDSYNEGACAQSGGVAGNAEAKLGDRTVFIGTCVGGLRTYHAWIEDRGVVVSAFSLGERRFGEQLMAGLRP